MEEATLQSEFKKLESTVSDIKETLSEVHGAIIGNPLSKDGGMAQRLIDAEHKLEELESRIVTAETKQIKYNLQTKIMWVTAASGATFLFAYVLQLIFKR